jgi:hypothetical protein
MSSNETLAAAASREVLSDSLTRLKAVVQQVEREVDQPTTPGRVAAWSHASIYQVSRE